MSTAKARVMAGALACSGIVAIAVGGAALFAPVAFFASNGIDLGASVSLRSEVRAAGGMNLAVGVLIFVGARLERMRRVSAWFAATFYLAYAASRLLGLALDGVPSESLVVAGAVELVLGVVGASVLIVLEEPRSAP